MFINRSIEYQDKLDSEEKKLKEFLKVKEIENRTKHSIYTILGEEFVEYKDRIFLIEILKTNNYNNIIQNIKRIYSIQYKKLLKEQYPHIKIINLKEFEKQIKKTYKDFTKKSN